MTAAVFTRRPHDGAKWIGVGLTIEDAAAAGRALLFAADGVNPYVVEALWCNRPISDQLQLEGAR